MAIIRAPITSLRVVISGVEIALGIGEHVVGRGLDCSVCIEDPLASRRHAAITVTSEHASIRDLGSRNGVLVNGDEIDGHRVLATGDLITLGSQAMTVVQIRRDHPPSERPRALSDVRTGERAPASESIPIARLALRARSAEPTVAKSPAAVPVIADLVLTTPEEDALDERMRAATTRGGSESFYRPVAAFRLIAEAARRAVSDQRPDRAEKILEVPLLEVLKALRAGKVVQLEILDLAAGEATMLYELTRQARWADYVRVLFDRRGCPVPPALADRLAAPLSR